MADEYVNMPDLTQETASSLDGAEQFVMFDTNEGKRATLSDVLTFILEGLEFTDTDGQGHIEISR